MQPGEDILLIRAVREAFVYVTASTAYEVRKPRLEAWRRRDWLAYNDVELLKVSKGSKVLVSEIV